MAKIEWVKNVDGSAGKSWNPVVGCSLASPGCTNCYAMKMAARLEAMGQRVDLDDNGYATGWINPLRHYRSVTQKSKTGAVWTGKVALAPENILTEPLHRKKPTTYFVNSMGDLFHKDVPDEWIDKVFAVMALCPQHTFQVLTKRAARMREYCSSPDMRGRIDRAAQSLNWFVDSAHDGCYLGMTGKWPGWPLPNVWAGVSAEDQTRADERIPDLLATPAVVRFVSCEPALGDIDLSEWLGIFWHHGRRGWYSNEYSYEALSGTLSEPWGDEEEAEVLEEPKLDWVICGGESGSNARPMHPDWAQGLRDQCQAAGVPFFFKQWGEWIGTMRQPGEYGTTSAATGEKRFWPENETSKHHAWADDGFAFRVGKRRAGCLLDGVEWKQMPDRQI